jgi:hypothetical protein
MSVRAFGLSSVSVSAVVLALSSCRMSVGEELEQSAGAGGRDTGAFSTFDCHSTELQGNDTRGAARRLSPEVTLCLRGRDQNWFYVDTPDDGKAHILEVLVAPEPEADVRFEVEMESDGSLLGSDYTADRATTYWATLGPGRRALLSFAGFSRGGQVQLKARMTAERDPYSPNQARESAAEIQVGQLIRAQLHQPYFSRDEQPYGDWYEARLEAAPYTVNFKQVIVSQRVSVNVLDARGELVADGHAATPGALLDLDFDVDTDGVYQFYVGDFRSGPGSFAVGKEPAAVSQSYSFEIVDVRALTPAEPRKK